MFHDETLERVTTAGLAESQCLWRRCKTSSRNEVQEWQPPKKQESLLARVGVPWVNPGEMSMPGIHQTLHFTREIRNLNTQSFTEVDGILCRYKDREGTLQGHEGRPGFNALLKRDNASGIFRIANLHESVAIPAVHFVAPGLAGRIKSDPSCMWMMGTTLLALDKGTGPCFSRRRNIGMMSTITFTLLYP